eukprot:GFUD01017330.1.p1 GENE.GFUD01017330.1~~GFUD01017330.1.p1  ORF type:complete len:371 (+),score=80.29 GFUD01017330.1:434-1546(+)
MSSHGPGISSWFWNPDIWLPPNVTWDSFDESDPEIAKEAFVSPGTFARFSDLWYPIPLAILVMIARWVVERGIFKKVGIWMGMKDYKRTFPAHNQVLESVFRSVTDPSLREVDHLSAESGLSIRQVERWFRQRRQAELPNTLQKFCETGWRFVFYLGILTYGFSCLWYKSWFWNIHNCWADYPNHKVDRDIWLYYMLELSFYWSLSISQFFDVKRKDFWGMFIHHNATIALMMFSWTTHFIRIGTLVLLVHDCADPLLELAKLFRYARYKKTCDAVFLVFSIVWVVTRCGVFPLWILYSTLFEGVMFIRMFPAYFIFNGLLGTLQLLHIVWTYLLYKVLKKALSQGNVDDMRSDSEPSGDETDTKSKKDT